MTLQRIVLSERDFTSLVSGQAVEKDGVAIILSDIGYSVMLNTIRNVMQANTTENTHTTEEQRYEDSI